MLNITLVKLTSSDFKYQYLNFISYERRNRIMKIKSVIDKKRSLISELLMRKSANEILGLPAGKIKFSYNPYGKPYIDNIRRYKFNVSPVSYTHLDVYKRQQEWLFMINIS